jgi:hypothetical protein
VPAACDRMQAVVKIAKRRRAMRAARARPELPFVSTPSDARARRAARCARCGGALRGAPTAGPPPRWRCSALLRRTTVAAGVAGWSVVVVAAAAAVVATRRKRSSSTASPPLPARRRRTARGTRAAGLRRSRDASAPSTTAHQHLLRQAAPPPATPPRCAHARRVPSVRLDGALRARASARDAQRPVFAFAPARIERNAKKAHFGGKLGAPRPSRAIPFFALQRWRAPQPPRGACAAAHLLLRRPEMSAHASVDLVLSVPGGC